MKPPTSSSCNIELHLLQQFSLQFTSVTSQDCTKDLAITQNYSPSEWSVRPHLFPRLSIFLFRQENWTHYTKSLLTGTLLIYTHSHSCFFYSILGWLKSPLPAQDQIPYWNFVPFFSSFSILLPLLSARLLYMQPLSLLSTSFLSPENKQLLARKTLPRPFSPDILDTAQIFFPYLLQPCKRICTSWFYVITSHSLTQYEFTQQNSFHLPNSLAVNPDLITQGFLTVKFFNISQPLFLDFLCVFDSADHFINLYSTMSLWTSKFSVALFSKKNWAGWS